MFTSQLIEYFEENYRTVTLLSSQMAQNGVHQLLA